MIQWHLIPPSYLLPENFLSPLEERWYPLSHYPSTLPPPTSWQPLVSLLSPWMTLFWILHVNMCLRCVPSFTEHNNVPKFIHVVACVRISFPFVAVCLPCVWVSSYFLSLEFPFPLPSSLFLENFRCLDTTELELDPFQLTSLQLV